MANLRTRGKTAPVRTSTKPKVNLPPRTFWNPVSDTCTSKAGKVLDREFAKSWDLERSLHCPVETKRVLEQEQETSVSYDSLDRTICVGNAERQTLRKKVSPAFDKTAKDIDPHGLSMFSQEMQGMLLETEEVTKLK